MNIEREVQQESVYLVEETTHYGRSVKTVEEWKQTWCPVAGCDCRADGEKLIDGFWLFRPCSFWEAAEDNANGKPCGICTKA